MNRRFVRPARTLAFACFAAASLARSAPTFTDADWVSMGDMLGANDTVYASALDSSGNLYIGGDFTQVGAVPAFGIAMWNGKSWSALGAGLSGVRALAVSGTSVYAGGLIWGNSFYPSGFVVEWTGTNWVNLGSGMDRAVFALAVSGTNLIAGGDFTQAAGVSASKVALWNGSSWTDLGQGVSAVVNALAIAGNNIIAGSGTIPGIGSVARWDGSTWTRMGADFAGTVTSLAVAGTNVIAGGFFNTARWDGQAWADLGPGSGMVRALAVSGTNVFAADRRASGDLGVSQVNTVRTWDGTNWVIVGSPMNADSFIYTLAAGPTNLYAGGDFIAAGGRPASRIACWNGKDWFALGSGTGGTVNALVLSGTNVYAGGQHRVNPLEYGYDWGNGIAYVAEVDEVTGSPLSPITAVMTGGDFPSVNALAVAATNLYAGGHFTTAVDIPAMNIARWDGSSWSPLASGVGDYRASVSALTVMAGKLYVGGSFTTAGGIAASNIAGWDGVSWFLLNSGLNGPVSALASSGSSLYAGGTFTASGAIPALNIAKWDGTAWSAVGSGITGSVTALAASDTELYAGATSSTDASSASVLKWDGASWSVVGRFSESPVTALALPQSGKSLFVGFRYGPGVVRWDGQRWWPLATGTGTGSVVSALAASGTDLFVGGSFTTAGGKFSLDIARARSLVARDATYARASGLALTIPITDLAGDLLFGNAVTVQSLGASAQGASINFDSTNIDYLPVNDQKDSFSYTASNGYGTATGQITVTVGTTVKSIAISGGTVTLSLYGEPGRQYDVQRTTNLDAPAAWITVTTSALSPAADGSMSLTDPRPANRTAYYRALQH